MFVVFGRSRENFDCVNLVIIFEFLFVCLENFKVDYFKDNLVEFLV